MLSFFAVFALGLTGCSDDPDVAPATPVIKASNPADIAAGGGAVKLNYEVENPVDGESITATSDVSWLHDFTATETQIVCEADANTGKPVRPR